MAATCAGVWVIGKRITEVNNATISTTPSMHHSHSIDGTCKPRAHRACNDSRLSCARHTRRNVRYEGARDVHGYSRSFTACSRSFTVCSRSFPACARHICRVSRLVHDGSRLFTAIHGVSRPVHGVSRFVHGLFTVCSRSVHGCSRLFTVVHGCSRGVHGGSRLFPGVHGCSRCVHGGARSWSCRFTGDQGCSRGASSSVPGLHGVIATWSLVCTSTVGGARVHRMFTASSHAQHTTRRTITISQVCRGQARMSHVSYRCLFSAAMMHERYQVKPTHPQGAA